MSRSSDGNETGTEGVRELAATDPSQVGEIRRAAASLARALGFDETAAGKVALVATELASNLVKHAHDGTVLLGPIERGGQVGIDVIALDRGPGMADVGRCFRDGFSTTGTPGTGLGAVVRLSAFVDLYSREPSGTALLARLWAGPAPAEREVYRLGAVCLPAAGEEACGDAWAAERQGNRVLLMVADGLGHGPLAAEAARTAVRVFRARSGSGPAEILHFVHQALRGTRGAVMAAAEVRLDTREVRFAGVGNVAGCIVGEAKSVRMVSHNGTLGYEARKFHDFTYLYPPGAVLVMHSDGLGSRWDLAAYPGLARQDPALVAGVLHRDFTRGRDDVTVLVFQEEGSAP